MGFPVIDRLIKCGVFILFRTVGIWGRDLEKITFHNLFYLSKAKDLFERKYFHQIYYTFVCFRSAF